ncbi:MAG: hypothetical protein E7053_09690 [Lentisphaerae bacterium]|nr:hypothetical protein [Lentisphaerota bacterium]
MAVGKKGRSAVKEAGKKVASWAWGKIFRKSLLVIFLLLLGGLLFNLDRLGRTGINLLKYKDYLPGFVVRMLPGGGVPEGRAVPQQILNGQVIEIYDGDTLTLLVSDGGTEKRYKVRFYGIDAPEADQEYGIASRDALRGKILGENVRVEVISVDRYGRSVGKVMLGGRYINLEMVFEGNAWYYADYASGERDLENAQNSARRLRQGLWQKHNPLPPWEYRREKRD